MIPPGRVATYGDIGGIAGVGPRQVGLVLSRWGADVPWWRVTSANGDLAPVEAARAHWAAEGITPKPNGRGCRLAAHRADPHQLAADYAEALPALRQAQGPTG